MPRTTHHAMIEHPVTARRRALESAVADAGAGAGPPRRLYEAVLEFLTRGGESEVLAAWVMAVHRAAGTIQPPGQGSPAVSVIVPCHNYGAYLRECVESVLAQTFTAWEIIVVNDGSTDDTAAVAAGLLADYPGHRIRYVEQERRGIVQPRNRGVTLAKGEFILPLDADDLLAPTFLERTVEVLENRPELGYVSTRALFFGSTNKIWPAEPFQPLALLVTNQQTNTTLYRRRMWRDVGGYDERMVHGYMDWEFWIRCTKKGWTGTQIEEPLFFYRRKADSVVMRAKKRDAAIKEQIIRLHPDVYDVAALPRLREEMNAPNWIPPGLIREQPHIGEPPDRHEAARFSRRVASAHGASRVAPWPEAARQALDFLGHVLPGLSPVFRRGAHGETGPAGDFHSMQAHFSNKVRTLLARGDRDRALETAAILAAANPLQPGAVLLLLQALAGCGKIGEALEIAKFYFSLLGGIDEIAVFLAHCLLAWARSEQNPHFALGLLEGAALLAGHDEVIVAARDAQRARLGLPSLAADAPDAGNAVGAPVWYVTDCFGYGAGGVNGVSQAKSMTLASLVLAADDREVCVILPLKADLPEAMAEFAARLGRIGAGGSFRWPRWLATVGRAGTRRPGDGETVITGGERPVCPEGPAPACIIVEGVRLDAHDYLQKLGISWNCPRVFMHHTSPDQFRDTYTDKNMLPRVLEALADYRRCVGVSSSVIAQWQSLDGLGNNIWTHIPNCAREEEIDEIRGRDPLELRRALHLPDREFVVLCLASVQWRKGQDVLFSQLAEVFRKLPGARVLCVGPILPQWGGREIVEAARGQFDPEQVQFLGPRRNALEYLHAADCLVLPSREEALPLTILEAMALGKPCVASDVNGIPELVRHGRTGLLFPHSTPRYLAGHLVALGLDGAARREMGKNARQRYLDHFSRARHVRRWRDLLDDIAGGSATPGICACREPRQEHGYAQRR